MRQILFLLLLLVSFSSHSQTMQGVVTDAKTNKPLSAVTVVNVTTQQATSTDDHGNYSIEAKPGEMIAFTYIGYKTVQKIKPASVLIATVNVTMETTEYQLEEFRLRPGHLTQYQLDSVERTTIYRNPLGKTHPSVFTSPVSAIAEKFSPWAKRIYRFQQTFAEGEKELYINSRYNAKFVSAFTGLTEDSLGNFMNAYPMPYDFARAATDLELKMWIRNNYKAWMNRTVTDTAHKH
jgi:hypothetical protein